MADREYSILISAKEVASVIFEKVASAGEAVGKQLEGVGERVGELGEQLLDAFEHPVDAIKAVSNAITEHLASALKTLGPAGEVAAGALLGAAAVVGALGVAILELGERGSNLNDIQVAFDGLAAGMKLAGGEVLEHLRAGTAGLIDDMTLMLASSKAMRAGFHGTADDFETLGGASRALAKSIGGDTKAAYEDLMQAMITGRTRGLLSTYGAMVDVKSASSDLKDALRTLNEENTTGADVDAKRKAVLELAREIMKQSGDEALDFGEKIEKGKVALKNFADQVAIAVAESPAMNAAIKTIGDLIRDAFGNDKEAAIRAVVRVVDNFAVGMITAAEIGVSTAKYITVGWDAMNLMFNESMTVIMLVVEGFLKGLEATTSAASRLPVVGDMFAGVSAKIGAVSDSTHILALGFAEQGKQAIDSGNQSVAAYDAINDGLAKVKSAMLAAMGATNDHTAAVKVLTGASADAKSATDKHKTATEELWQKMEALNVALQGASDHNLSLVEVEKLHGSELKDLTLKAKELGLGLPQAMQDWNEAIDADQSAEKLDKINQIIAKANTKAFDDRMKQSFKAAESQIKDGERALSAEQEIDAKFNDLYLTSTERAIAAADKQRDEYMKRIEPLKTTAPAEWQEAYDRIQVLHQEAVTAAGNAGQQQAQSFGDHFSNYLETTLPQTIMSAITGGGQVFEAIGSSLGGFLVSKDGFGAEIESKLTSLLPAGLAKSITSMLPGIGSLMGPLVGKIAGMISDAFSTAGRDAVTSFADQMGGFDALHEKLNALGAAGEQYWIKLTQGTPKNDPAAAKAVIDEITAALDKQKQAASDAAAATAQAYADAQDKIGGALAGVTGKIGQQATSYVALQKTVTDAQKAYDDLVTSGGSQADIAKAAKELAQAQEGVKAAAVTSQDEFDRLSRIALNTFSTLVASGVGPVEAMQRVGGSVDDLIHNVDAFGLSGNAAFDELKRWRDLTETNAPLLQQVGSLNDLIQMTSTLGGLNADTFKDMQAQGVTAYDQLRKAGFSEQEAETQMKPLLESIIKAHKDKGLAIDENTQKLIDQATQDGVLSKEEMSTNDVLMQGLGAIITAVGGTLPAAWDTMAKSAKTAAESVKTKATDPTVLAIEDVADKAKDPVAWALWKKNAVDAANDATSAVGSVSDAISGVFDDFKNGVNIPINFDITQTGKAPSASSAGDGSGVPGFADEGYIKSPTLAMIAETTSEFVLKPSTIGNLINMAQWQGARAAQAANGPAGVTVNIVNDPSTNTARQVTEAEFTQIQNRLSSGRLRVPTRVSGQRVG